jgi:hypothetical protein
MVPGALVVTGGGCKVDMKRSKTKSSTTYRAPPREPLVAGVPRMELPRLRRAPAPAPAFLRRGARRWRGGSGWRARSVATLGRARVAAAVASDSAPATTAR